MSVPWGSKGFKVTPVNADQLLIIDSEDATPATTNKRITIGSLPIIGEANTTSNSGVSGEGLAQDKDGIDLPFKSLIGETGKIVLTGNTDDVTFTVGTDIVQTTQTNTFGDFAQFFADNQLFIQNPTDTFSYQIIADAILGNFSLSFPLLTANDTFVTEAFTQVLSNKELTTPIIADFTNAGHDHTNTVGGEQLVATTALTATGTKDPTTFLRGDDTWDTPIGTSLPVVDTTSIVEGSADNTKELRFEVDGFTTGTIRVLTPPDSDGTIVLETFTQTLTNKSITYSGRAQWDKGTDIPSPAGGILTLGTDGNVFTITGTNTINQILAAGWQAGSVIILEFDDVLTVTNNSGGTNDIILGDGANYITAAGESLELWFDGTDWREISRSIGIGGAGGGITSINGNSNAAQFITGVTNKIVIDSATTPGTTNIDVGSLVVLTDQANSYTAGVRQDFLGDTAGTSGLNVGGITSNPTTQANGDIWLNTTDNKIFGRINGANVDLGAGGVTTFPDDAFAVQNVSDPTKQMIVSLGGAIAGTTTTLFFDQTVDRIITFPDDTTELVGSNIPNTWTTGLQDFTSATLRIPVASDPTIDTPGDIAINDNVINFTDDVIEFFGSNAAQGIVSMPATAFDSASDGQVVSYNFANKEFELVTLAGTGDVVGPVSADDTAIALFDGTTGKLLKETSITIGTAADMANIQSLEFIDGDSPGIATSHIALVETNDFHINTSSGNNIQLLINGETKLQVNQGSIEIGDAVDGFIPITMGESFIQFSATTTGVTGADTVGKLFLNSDGNHLSVIKDDSIIDLEAINFPIDFPEQTAATATASQEINFSANTRHAQKYTLDQALTTFSFAGTTTDTTEYIDLLLVQDATGSRAIAFPGGTINAAEVIAGLDQTALAETSILVKFHYGNFYVFLQGDSNGEVFTWSGNHSMATFKLTAEAANDVIINAPTGNAFDVEVNSVLIAKIGTALANFNGQDATQVLELEANHTTPTNDQVIGKIDFIDDDNLGARRTYALIESQIEDPLNTSLDGIMKFSIVRANSLEEYIRLDFAGVTISNTLLLGSNVLSGSGNWSAGTLELTNNDLTFVTASNPVHIDSALQDDDEYIVTIPELFNDQGMVVTLEAQTLTNKTLTEPRFVDLGFIADANGNEMLAFDTITTAVNYTQLANSDVGNQLSLSALGTDADIDFRFIPKGTGTFYGNRETWGWPLTDESTAPTTGVKFTTEPAPYDMEIEDAIAGLTIAGTTDTFTVDVLKEDEVNDNGFTTIFSTKPTIDATEFTSTTAAAAPVISVSTWEKGRRLQLSIDTLDTGGTARGVKIDLVTHATAK